jgi:hypothetical protein
MKPGSVILGVILLALGCGTLGLFAAAGAFDTFKEQAISSAEKAVLSQLKDPSSADFQDVSLVYGPPLDGGPLPSREMYTCGWVNARNGFGAMAGKTRFVVQQDATKWNGKTLYSTYEATIEEPSSDAETGEQSSFDIVYWRDCRGQPVPDDG